MSHSPVELLIPAGVRKAARRLRTLWSVGAFSDPLELLRRWRHREPFARLQKALYYHRWSTAVLLAHELRLWDALGARAATTGEIAVACDVHPHAAEHLVRILEGQGLLVRESAGEPPLGNGAGHAARTPRFRASDFARAHLPAAAPFTIAPMLDLMAAQAAAFPEVVPAMRGGAAPSALDVFSETGRYAAFLGAVNAYLVWAGRELLHRVELPPVRSFIVGSMGVSFSALLLERFPRATVTYGCLAHLVREIPRLRRTYAVPPARVQAMHAHGGEPENDRWGDAPFDLVLLTRKMILDPERRVGERFARKAFEQLRPKGTAILWETVHPDGAPTPPARAMESVLDLCAAPTAPVLTEGSVRTLLERIGYERIEVVPCLGGQTTFVVARRP